MSRLVVISNRIADPRKPAAGGLAVALGETLHRTGGMWFGWSGTIAEDGLPGEGKLQTRQAGSVTLATVDLCREDHDAYYAGYSNSVLWPVFHYRLDLADFNAGYVAGYRRVNQMFARKLLPLLKEDDILWVHDYHLIPLAAELRALGCRQRIGFFLHIPVPPPLIMAAIPQHEWLMRSMFAYDLVGLQSEADVAHFTRYLSHEGGAESVGPQRLRAFGGTVQVGAFPIGIDVDEFTRLASAPDAVQTCEALKNEYSRRRLLMGIDRLDYSKGIPQRVRAFSELLARYPENQHSATLIMIASPTRDSVDAYADLRQELEGLCGAINGDHGDLDWMPVRYTSTAPWPASACPACAAPRPWAWSRRCATA
ncbi:Trehalose 6-phosphate synthase [Paracidovorax anthurii]|uniref:Trehalose 6-phosphate synthase n=1 Tax=Paracidovorax anthurii TaxID=78229 RepID=A0A328ZCW7_9BURK|nr:trehalose 6-phosphate synthase [Paracidovorax anthurii]